MPLNKLCNFASACEQGYNSEYQAMHGATQPSGGCLNTAGNLQACTMNSSAQHDVSHPGISSSGRQTVPDRGADVGSGTGIAGVAAQQYQMS